MEDFSFECVRPQEDHAKLIMKWRNDPETLRMSFHTTPKVWKTFYPEFLSEYFNFPELPPLFIQKDGERVAFIRLNPVPHPMGRQRKCCEISINVAPAARGKGIGTNILKAVQQWVVGQGYDDLYAEVKKENKASQKAFEQAGFIRLSDGVKEIEDIGKSIPILRYFIELTPDTVQNQSVFIIAEAGSNWRMGTPKRDLAMAKSLIDAAVEAEADAIKFQTYKPDTIYVPNAGQSNYLSDAGILEDMQEIFIDLAMPYEMVPKLAEYCKKQGIQFMSSTFSPADFKAVDPFVNIHKIASYEIGHIHLLRLAAESGKPLLLSTGAATEEEINWAVQTFYKYGGKHLTLLQCTACYPAEVSTLNLRAIPWLHQRFHVPVGLSDHSRHPTCAPTAAVALGAVVIEKHFTLHNALPGPDHSFAITPNELKELVHAVRRAELMLGPPIKTVDPSEEELRAFARRGIQAIKGIKKGEVFKENSNIAILRPGQQSLGVHSKHLSAIVGKKAKRNIPLGAGLQHGDWS